MPPIPSDDLLGAAPATRLPVALTRHFPLLLIGRRHKPCRASGCSLHGLAYPPETWVTPSSAIPAANKCQLHRFQRPDRGFQQGNRPIAAGWRLVVVLRQSDCNSRMYTPSCTTRPAGDGGSRLAASRHRQGELLLSCMDPFYALYCLRHITVNSKEVEANGTDVHIGKKVCRAAAF